MGAGSFDALTQAWVAGRATPLLDKRQVRLNASAGRSKFASVLALPFRRWCRAVSTSSPASAQGPGWPQVVALLLTTPFPP